jgi:ubiquitin-protein ligase
MNSGNHYSSASIIEAQWKELKRKHYPGVFYYILSGGDLVVYMQGPKDSLYEEGIYGFRLMLDDYPAKMPKVSSLIRIKHVNINNQVVCVTFFDEATNKDTTLMECVKVLSLLLGSPNPKSALTVASDLVEEYLTDPKAFELKVKQSAAEGFKKVTGKIKTCYEDYKQKKVVTFTREDVTEQISLSAMEEYYA